MKHESIEEALVAAQAEMPGVAFDATNPFLKNKYASLGAIIKTAQPILAKHGLAIMQMVKTDDVGRMGLETMLVHEGGKSISTTAFLPLNLDAKSIAQDAGSIITYLRRYSLAAMLGMYADEDVDGNAPKPAQPAQAKAQAEPEPEPHAEKMGLATAMAVKSSDGTAYGEIPTDKLSHMHNNIVKQLKALPLGADQREEYEFKRDAIETILANRK